MDPSKELDKLFHEIKHNDRAPEARRKSWLKIQDKVAKKRRHIVPIIISIVMVTVAVLLAFNLINQTPNPKQSAVAIPIEDKNKAAIQAVLKSEFTAPNQEFLRLENNLNMRRKEFSQKEKEGVKYTSDPLADTPEWAEYKEFLKKTYEPFFMDYEFENFTIWAFHYHHFLMNEETPYQLSISNIEVLQSENPKTPKSYKYTALVQYVKADGDVKTYEIEGKIICSEPGKIGRYEFPNNGVLLDEINDN